MGRLAQKGLLSPCGYRTRRWLAFPGRAAHTGQGSFRLVPCAPRPHRRSMRVTVSIYFSLVNLSFVVYSCIFYRFSSKALRMNSFNDIFERIQSLQTWPEGNAGNDNVIIFSYGSNIGKFRSRFKVVDLFFCIGFCVVFCNNNICLPL